MSLFSRPESNYVIEDSVVAGVVRDKSNPLFQIASRIPDGAQVLDVGAGSGILPRVSAALGKRAIFDGIEPNAVAADVARRHYRRFYQGFLADCPFLEELQSYDVVVMADVIEHTVDPAVFLRTVAQRLSQGGRILLSVPNVAFASVRIALLNGDFNYVDSGLLERSHLRFFTLRTLEALVSEVDLHIRSIVLLERDPMGTEIDLRHYEFVPIRLLARDPLARAYQLLVDVGLTPGDTKMTTVGVPRGRGIRRLAGRLKRRLAGTLQRAVRGN